MGKKPEIVDLAKKDSKIIAKYLRANHKVGESISKSAIQLRFNLPHNRAVLVFKALELDGLINEYTFITVM